MKIEPAQTSQYHCPETETLCSKCESHCEAAQPVQPSTSAEDYLRGKYGAYRGHFAWRELEEAFNAGKQAQPVQTAGAQESVAWQPIVTAPKDNKRALYLARFNDEGELAELDFNGAWEYWQESWELAHINGYCWTSENGIEEPTHWAYQDEALPIAKHPAPDAAINEQLIGELKHIAEYWNRDQNERAMADALWHIIRVAEAAIAAAQKELDK